MTLEELMSSDGSAGAPLELEGTSCTFTWSTGYADEYESCGTRDVIACDRDTFEGRCVEHVREELDRQSWYRIPTLDDRLAAGARNLIADPTAGQAPGIMTEEYGR